MSNIQRSKAYPSIDLGAAIERVKKFNDKLGSVGYHDRDQVAKGIGYAGISGSSGRTIGALVHYGLLERSKDKYGLSDIAKTILYSYASEEERHLAIQEAALQPALFRELTEQYNGNDLPSLLSNILTSPQFGINQKVKDEVAEIYRATLTYAGMLNGNRVVLGEVDPQPEPIKEEEPYIESFGNQSNVYQPVLNDTAGSNNAEINRIEIVLREGVKAGIYAPHNLSDAEKNKLKTIIDLL